MFQFNQCLLLDLRVCCLQVVLSASSLCRLHLHHDLTSLLFSSSYSTFSSPTPIFSSPTAPTIVNCDRAFSAAALRTSFLSLTPFANPSDHQTPLSPCLIVSVRTSIFFSWNSPAWPLMCFSVSYGFFHSRLGFGSIITAPDAGSTRCGVVMLELSISWPVPQGNTHGSCAWSSILSCGFLVLYQNLTFFYRGFPE